MWSEPSTTVVNTVFSWDGHSTEATPCNVPFEEFRDGCLIDMAPYDADSSPRARASRMQARPTSGGALTLICQRCLGSRNSRLSGDDRARHAILSWRLRRPYLVYTFIFSTLTAYLLLWNLLKAAQNGWNIPQWKHHRWEEWLEVTIGAGIVVETCLTLYVLGVRSFFSSWWCIFDFTVALLTVVSISYGLVHLGRKGEVCEANMPLLLVRFVLQPVRVLTVCRSTCQTRNIQNQVDSMVVDFDSIPAGHSGLELIQGLH